MLAVSTSWVTDRTSDPEEILAALLELGVEGVELDCQIDAPTFAALRPRLRKVGLAVVSVHNFFPAPDVAPEPGGDALLFTSEDDRERELTLRYTLRTLETAADLEAGAVVLHLGRVILPRDEEELYRLYREERGLGRAAEEEWERIKRRRAELAPRFLDRVCLALDRILRAAERLGVRVGIENRYHYYEIPSPDEIAFLLREFAGAPLGYWHDTGHAHHWQVMGWADQEDFLRAFSDHLLGLHLHDAKGPDDHLAPGTGEIDFTLVARYLKEDTLRVCEVHSQSDAQAYRQGLELLRRLGF